MQVTAEYRDRDSYEEFRDEMRRMLDSGAGVIHVRAEEVVRAGLSLRKMALLEEAVYREWDVVHGTREFTLDNYRDSSVTGDGNISISSAFAAPLEEAKRSNTSGKMRFYVYVQPTYFMENNPELHQLLLLYNDSLTDKNIVVVLLTQDAPLPATPANNSILTVRFGLPGFKELQGSLDLLLERQSSVFQPIDDEYKRRLCYAGAGMTQLQFETYVALALVKAAETLSEADLPAPLDPEAVMEVVRKGKTDVVNTNDLLELYHPANMSDVGGLENLKEWVRQRQNCYTDEAAEFGIEPPKGAVLVGVPGTGKSLVAKAISKELGVPLVRLDFGRVFSSLVGSSEQRIRGALSMVEAMAPCVLFCDEIDKGLGGIANGSGGDSGVSMRVLGSFLTWLQEVKAPVFTLVTANNVDGLPPEMLRRGRFDAIFSTTLPHEGERKEVLSIHLRKRGRSLDDMDESTIKRIVAVSDGYVPAEIESAVKDGLVAAFSNGEEFSGEHIVSALKSMVPLSKAFAAKFETMRRWAEDNATPASTKYVEEEAVPTSGTGQRSRIGSVRRTRRP